MRPPFSLMFSANHALLHPPTPCAFARSERSPASRYTTLTPSLKRNVSLFVFNFGDTSCQAISLLPLIRFFNHRRSYPWRPRKHPSVPPSKVPAVKSPLISVFPPLTA